MTRIPPLSRANDLGGEAFEKLMHQLLLAYASKHDFEYEPHGKSGAADGGIDGRARAGPDPRVTLCDGEIDQSGERFCLPLIAT